MKIIIGGIHRSGSTWQYNAVRLSIQMSGHEVYGSLIDAYNPNNPAPIHIIKTHKFHEDLQERAGIVFTSYRNIHEIKESFERREALGEKDNRGWVHINHHIIHLLRWQQHATHCTFFDRIVKKPVEEIVKIQQAIRRAGISITADPKAISKKINAMKSPKKGYDPETLFNRNHFTSR